MNTSSKLLGALFATMALAGCDRPTVVTTPPAVVVPAPVPVPGPAGPQGEAGKPGTDGSAAVIMVPAPAASEPK